MALFRRKTTDSVLPEVDEYYQAERRDRGWLAWLLAFLSVAVVVFLIIGLFLGGRWAYNKLAGNDDAPVAVTDNDNQGEGLTIDGEPNDADNDNNDNDNEQAPAAGENADGTADESEGDQTPSAQDSTSDTEDTTSTPITGDTTSDLPNTGPADLIGVFAGVSTLAGGIHYAVTRRRN